MNQEQRQAPTVPYTIFLSNGRTLLVMFCCMISSGLSMGGLAMVSPRLRELGLPTGYGGLFIAAGCLAYALTAPVFGFLCTLIKRQVITIFGFLFGIISCFLMGPS